MKFFKVSDLMRMVDESANKSEFKPVVGKGVTAGDKEINGKAYADMDKDAKRYYKNIKDIRSRAEQDGYDYSDNKGMSDIMFDGPVGKAYSDRIKSQSKGYVSAQAEKLHKNDPFGNADFGDDRFYANRFKNNAKQHKANRDKATMIGLTGRELDKREVEKVRNTAFGEGKIRRLTFKNTQFISESDMLARIPDDMKTEGRRFVMRDSMDNEYLVEWHKRLPDVTKKVNQRVVNEEIDKIKKLYSFEHGRSNSTPQQRITEEKEFSDMMDKARSHQE